MNTPVPSEITAVRTAIIAFVAGEWTLAGMSTLVTKKKNAISKSKIALIAGKWTPIH